MTTGLLNMYSVFEKNEIKWKYFRKWKWSLSKIIMQLRTETISKIIWKVKIKFKWI